MRQGQLVYVMGASGSGKDSLLQALRPRLRGGTGGLRPAVHHAAPLC